MPADRREREEAPVSDTIEQATISVEAAQRVLAAALAEAQRSGLAMCVAVSGLAGDLKAFARMDGAPPLSARIAMDKAYTVAAFGLPTHAWWDLIKDEPALVHGITKTERLVIFGGGVLLVLDGQRVGAVGVSGGSAEEDRRVAEAGAAALPDDDRARGRVAEGPVTGAGRARLLVARSRLLAEVDCRSTAPRRLASPAGQVGVVAGRAARALVIACATERTAGATTAGSKRDVGPVTETAAAVG